MGKRESTEYDRIEEPVCSRVLVIEVVLPSDAEAEPTDLEEVLERLRQYSAAELVDDFYVRSDFDATAKVLMARGRALRASQKSRL